MLQGWLARRGIPALIVRGDGSRPGQGRWPGDPPSSWWQAANPWLHGPKATLHDWNIAAYRLARELVIWRERVLPRCLQERGEGLGVLIVDRSLLSRAVIALAMGVHDVTAHLYPKEARLRGNKIAPERVCPDQIFYLNAPKDVLLARLDAGDAKYQFRKWLIEESSDRFDKAADRLPSHLRARVVEIDASRPSPAVFEDVLHRALEIRKNAVQILDKSCPTWYNGLAVGGDCPRCLKLETWRRFDHV